MDCRQHWPNLIKLIVQNPLNVSDEFIFIRKCGGTLTVVFTILCSGLILNLSMQTSKWSNFLKIFYCQQIYLHPINKFFRLDLLETCLLSFVFHFCRHLAWWYNSSGMYLRIDLLFWIWNFIRLKYLQVVWCVCNYIGICIEMTAKHMSKLPPLSIWKVLFLFKST